MRAAIPTELLLRLMNATPEQYAAVERVLGVGAAHGRWQMAKGDACCALREGQAESRGVPTPRYLFRAAGHIYDVVFDGSPLFHLPKTDGAKYLDYLFHHPNELITALDLEQRIKPEKAAVREQNSVQRTVDERARREAREELVALLAELEEAEGCGDRSRAARLQEEITQIKAIARNEGLLDGDGGERARNNVRRAIENVVKRLRRGGNQERAFAEHITQHVIRGYEVMYHQPQGRIWQ